MKIKNTFKPLITFMLLLVTIMTVVIIATMILKPNGSFIPTDKQISEEDPLYKNKTLDKPSDLKALEIEDYKKLLYISIGEVYNQKYYNTKSYGNTKANSFIGTFEQEISGYKIIYENDIFSESLSKGSVVSVAKQRFVDLKNGYYLIRDGKLKTLDNVSWKEIKKISQNDFMNMYGNTYKDFSQYIFNDESIHNVELLEKDENYITIKVTLKIDPKSHDNLAVARYKREIKTMSNSTNFPNFLSCEIEIKIDNDFKILKTISHETYVVDKIGNPTCKTTIYQDFFYDKKEIELKKEYEKHFHNENNDIKDKKPSEILLPMVADLYLNKASFDLEAFNQVFKGELNLRNFNLYIQNDKLDLLFDKTGLYFKYNGKSYKISSQILAKLGAISTDGSANNNSNFLTKIPEILKIIDNMSEVEKIDNGCIVNINLFGFADVKIIISNDKLEKIEVIANINNKEERLVLTVKNNKPLKRITFDDAVDVTSKINLSEDFVFATLIENIKAKLDILKKLNLSVDLTYKNKDFDIKIKGIVSVYDKHVNLDFVFTNSKIETKLGLIINNDKVFIKLNDKIYEDNLENVQKLINKLLKNNNVTTNNININNISIDFDKVLNIFENITLGNDYLDVFTNYLDIKFNLNSLTLNLIGKNIDLNGNVTFLKDVTKEDIVLETIKVDSNKLYELLNNAYNLATKKQNSFDINLQFNDILANGNVVYDLNQNRVKVTLNVPSLKIKGLIFEYFEGKIYIIFNKEKLVFSRQAFEKIISKQSTNENNYNLSNVLGFLSNKININEFINLINFKDNQLILETKIGNIHLHDKKILIEKLNIQNNIINASIVLNENLIHFEDININEYTNLDQLLTNIKVDENFNFNNFYNTINQKLPLYKKLSGEIDLTYQKDNLIVKVIGKISYLNQKLYVEANIDFENEQLKAKLHVILNENNIYVTFNNYKYYDSFEDVKNTIPKLIEFINKVTNKQITNPISSSLSSENMLDIISLIKEIKLLSISNQTISLDHKYGKGLLDITTDKFLFTGLDKLTGLIFKLDIKEIEKVSNLNEYNKIELNSLLEKANRLYDKVISNQNTFNFNLDVNNQQITGILSYDKLAKLYYVDLNIADNNFKVYLENDTFKLIYKDKYFIVNKLLVLNLVKKIFKKYPFIQNLDLDNLSNNLQLPNLPNQSGTPNGIDLNQLLTKLVITSELIDVIYDNIEVKLENENKLTVNNLVFDNITINGSIEILQYNEIIIPNNEYTNLDQLLTNIKVDENFDFNNFYNTINQKLPLYKKLSSEIDLTYQKDNLIVKVIGKISYLNQKLYVEANIDFENEQLKAKLHVILNENNIYVTFNNYKYYDSFEDVKNTIPKLIEFINKVTNKQITNPISSSLSSENMLDIISLIKEIKLLSISNQTISLDHKYGKGLLDITTDKFLFTGLDKLTGLIFKLDIKEIEKVSNLNEYNKIELNSLLEKANRLYDKVISNQNTFNFNLDVNNQQITGILSYDKLAKLYYVDLNIADNNFKVYLENDTFKLIYKDKYFIVNKLLVLNLVKKIFKKYPFIQNLDLDNLSNNLQLPNLPNQSGTPNGIDLNQLLTKLVITSELIDVIYDNIEVKLENENKLTVNNLVFDNITINGSIEILQYNEIIIPNNEYTNLDQLLTNIKVDENISFNDLYNNIKKTLFNSNYIVDLELLTEEKSNLSIKGTGYLSLKDKIYFEITINIKINNYVSIINLYYKDNKIYVQLPNQWEQISSVVGLEQFLNIYNRVVSIISLSNQSEAALETGKDILSKIKEITINTNNLFLTSDYFNLNIDILNPNITLIKDKLRINMSYLDTEVLKKEVEANIHYEDLDNLVRTVENIISLKNNYDNQYLVDGLVYENNEKVYEYTGSIQTDFRENYDLLIDVQVRGIKEKYGNHYAKLIIKNQKVYVSYSGMYSKTPISFKLPLLEFKKSAKTILNFMGIEGKLIDAILDVNVEQIGGLFNGSVIVGEGRVINLNDVIKSYRLTIDETNSKIAKFILNVKDIFNNQSLKDYSVSIDNGKDIVNKIILNDFYTSENIYFDMNIINENKPSEILVDENNYKHDFANIYNLVLGATKSASLRKYHLKGNLHFDFPSPVSDLTINDFDLKIKLKEDNTPIVRAEMTIPSHYFWLFGYKYITNGETKLIVYFENNIIYVDQIFRLWGTKPPQYIHYHITKEQFDKNVVDEIFKMINAGDYLKQQMTSQSSSGNNNSGNNIFDINKIFKSYSTYLVEKERNYKVVLDGKELSKSNQVRDIEITMSTMNDFLKKIYVLTNVGPKGAFSIDIKANLSIENTEDNNFDLTLPDFSGNWWRTE